MNIPEKRAKRGGVIDRKLPWNRGTGRRREKRSQFTGRRNTNTERNRAIFDACKRVGTSRIAGCRLKDCDPGNCGIGSTIASNKEDVYPEERE